LPPLTEAQMNACRTIYDRFIRSHIHSRW